MLEIRLFFSFGLIVYLLRFSTNNKRHFLAYVCPTQLTSNEDRKGL